ncbi:uncharacterized protein K489DRAFT_246776 [Dissoconium aciculare CBS 342.82]|uniref:Uncharacterized protein n=1 Tax=Dissoconium aciculare CBS 342.82 TaxID=1314786 RepID=A0A6J3M026_9PEZI|nr:uncharacterized protein K489DRAFT_246776 [Dissoconium aciculare CBS 342.82]KAF1821361.1 hypothetical protein K489DRAFT_246776 [Dissoconium aciculare CBS 342.82]
MDDDGIVFPFSPVRACRFGKGLSGTPCVLSRWEGSIGGWSTISISPRALSAPLSLFIFFQRSLRRDEGGRLFFGEYFILDTAAAIATSCHCLLLRKTSFTIKRNCARQKTHSRALHLLRTTLPRKTAIQDGSAAVR